MPPKCLKSVLKNKKNCCSLLNKLFFANKKISNSKYQNKKKNDSFLRIFYKRYFKKETNFTTFINS